MSPEEQINNSKSFDLTKEEDQVLNWFIDKILNQYNKLKDNSVRLVKASYVEELAHKVSLSNEKYRWFFGRALITAFEDVRVFQDDKSFEKVLPDRSVFSFKETNLKEALYNIGKFYFKRMFGHRRESLRGTSQQWVDLDDYVVNREKEVKLHGMIKKLPELEGIF